MNDVELTRLVDAVLERELAAGKVVQKPWLTQKIVEEQSNGEVSDFYRACAYHAVSDIIGRLIRKVRASELEETTQLNLPGYERVQSRYAIQRGGKSCIVPIEQMTDEEGEAKARELDALAAGAKLHATELRRYFADRQAVGVGA